MSLPSPLWVHHYDVLAVTTSIRRHFLKPAADADGQSRGGEDFLRHARGIAVIDRQFAFETSNGFHRQACPSRTSATTTPSLKDAATRTMLLWPLLLMLIVMALVELMSYFPAQLVQYVPPSVSWPRIDVPA